MNLFGLFKKKQKPRSLDIADLILRRDDDIIRQAKEVIEIKHVLSHILYDTKKYTRYQLAGADYVYWFKGHVNIIDVEDDYCDKDQVQQPLFDKLEQLFKIKGNGGNRNLEAPTQESKDI